MLKLKIDGAYFASLPSDIQKEYQKTGDHYLLQTESENAMKALEAERIERKRFESELNALKQKTADMDLDKIKSDKVAADAAKQAALAKDGKFDEILEAKQVEYENQLLAEKERTSKIESEYLKKEVDQIIVSALAKAGVKTDYLDDAKLAVMARCEYKRVDGETIIRFKDDDGFAQKVDPADFMKRFKETKGLYFDPKMKKPGDGGRNDQQQPGGTIKTTDKLGSARERLKQHYNN